MSALLIQIQPDLADDVNPERICQEVEQFAANSSYVRDRSTSIGDAEGRYINIQLRTDDLRSLWGELRSKFYVGRDSDLARLSIVTCQGQHGWDDYRLLHHFDPDAKLDILDGNLR